jgi:4-amino-4-deoxy-L-arabinose transferase-like glycosyltransferase
MLALAGACLNRWSKRDLDIALVLALAALLLRLPGFMLMPVFTDEVDELYRAHLITRGELFPLVSASSYIGSLANYIMAAALAVSSSNIASTRLVNLLAGVLTVVLTYALGRFWDGRLVGLIAGALLATSGEHILVNSRVAWSHCMTPLFSTGAMLALGLALRRSTPSHEVQDRTAGRWLALSGLLGGLAFQTHPPSIGALLPGLAIFLVAQRGPLLRTRWALLAVGLFLLANANLAVYNLSTGFNSFTEASGVAGNYTYRQGVVTAAYFQRVWSFLLGFTRHLGGGVNNRTIGDAEDLLWDFGLWPALLASVVGLVLLWRRGTTLPALLLGSLCLILPVFNARYEQLLNSRYLAPLLPLLFVAAGCAIVRIGRRPSVLSRVVQAGLPRIRPRLARVVPAALLGLYVVVHPLVYLNAYERDTRAAGSVNDEVLQLSSFLASRVRSNEGVLIDDGMYWFNMGQGEGKYAWVFRLLLGLRGVANATVDLRGEGLQPRLVCSYPYVLLYYSPRELANEKASLLRLEEVEVPNWVPRRALFRSYGLYRSGLACNR